MAVGLSPEEIHEITGFTWHSKQIEALVLMEIPFRVRMDGSPFVARSAIGGIAEEGPTIPEGTVGDF